jgi:signal transduction histidine kinase
LGGLLHNAQAWFSRSAAHAIEALPGEFSRWLASKSADTAAGSIARAVAILAGRQLAPDLESEATAARQYAEHAARAWAESLPGMCVPLPALASRMARLEQLDRRFHETLEREKLDAMAELAAGAGHEINNPLTIITGRAQLFLRDETDPERRREAAVIVAQVKRAHEMIADMRLFARPPQPEPQSIDLAGLVDGVLAELAPQAAERACAILRVGDSGPLGVEADPAQVKVAVHALVRNALEAIGHGGQVEVELEADDAWAAVRVADNGPGIAPEHRQHIFEPFFSARQAGRGLGMGLSKCWRIVTQHGGRIEVDSRPGQGAVFTIRLPRRWSS